MDSRDNLIPGAAGPFEEGQVVSLPAEQRFGEGPAAAAPFEASPVIPSAFLGVRLPPHLWPHNFFYLSVICAVVIGFFNILTLFLLTPAVILGGVVSSN